MLSYKLFPTNQSRRGDAVERFIVMDLINDLSQEKTKFALLINNYGEPFFSAILSTVNTVMTETVAKISDCNKKLGTENDEGKRTMIGLTHCAMIERVKLLEELRRRIQFAREQHAKEVKLWNSELHSSP